MGVDLPTVNLTTFGNGPDWRRKDEAKKLSDSLIAHGFVKVIDHGIPNNVVQEIWEWASLLRQDTSQEMLTYPNIRVLSYSDLRQNKNRSLPTFQVAILNEVGVICMERQQPS